MEKEVFILILGFALEWTHDKLNVADCPGLSVVQKMLLELWEQDFRCLELLSDVTLWKQ